MADLTISYPPEILWALQQEPEETGSSALTRSWSARCSQCSRSSAWVLSTVQSFPLR
jgi:hypothetical protein